MRMVGEQFRQRRGARHRARRRLALCGTLRHAAYVDRRVRTGDYPQEARWRLARAIQEARTAAGHKFRPSFIEATGVSKRSLENAESLEANAASVGEAVLHAIARELPNWTSDTPRIILEGGPVPEVPEAVADGSREAWMKDVLDRADAIEDEAGWQAADTYVIGRLQQRLAERRQSLADRQDPREVS